MMMRLILDNPGFFAYSCISALTGFDESFEWSNKKFLFMNTCKLFVFNLFYYYENTL